MKKKLAIFDLDGTLFDTKDVNFSSYKYALEKYNYNLEYEYFCKECYGMSYERFLPEILKDDKVSIHDIHKLKKALYPSNLGQAKINEHLFNIIELLKEKYFLAIVTTASRKNCIEILKYFRKHDLFDLIISYDDVVHVKPNPEGFIKAMKFFNIEPGQTIIFEDSSVGIEAAEKSGAGVFVVNKF
ncbi:HAD family phosphatase [Clostridium chromiireducens]|uniref:HAD family phosphatase n=1 Tax=Clostridium chromiireducens TaxID=225345 RepID=A0A399IUG9_9CLOT|nr:HAD family phosphatase [Clostridium chromiireducens]RII36117.1 HAD family phosphatase [Clostridium chromiireducens]